MKRRLWDGQERRPASKAASGETLAKLSIASKVEDDALLGAFLERHGRRIAAMPPGICPVAAQLSLLQAAAAQTCGKCVPCRDGLPRLVAMIERVAACEAGEDELRACRSLAEMVRDTSDCAIGYEAAQALLEGMDAFASEYESHVRSHGCREGVKQSVPCETLCPAHVDVPGYIAPCSSRRLRRCRGLVRKDNPFPTACALVCEHPCEARCRRTLVDAPVNIRGIKRYAVDQLRRLYTVPIPAA